MTAVSGFLAGLVALLAPLLAGAPVVAINEVQMPPPAPAARAAEATILFGGDMMFDRYIRQQTERNNPDHALSCMTDVLQDADLVVANLEGPVTSHESMSMGSIVGSLENMTFTFPTSTAALLARHNIRMVNLGNNHILNFGEDGARETMVALAEQKVGFFGSPLQSAFVSREVGGIPFEFVSYNEFGGPGADVALHQIQAARGAGRTPIVHTHWGDEYATTSASRQQELAHQFIEAGAEIVIGSHPHVIQEHEVYRGKHIYYSLGNFVFDQYWNEDVSTGLLVRAVFTENGVESVEEIPITLKRDGRTCLKEAVE